MEKKHVFIAGGSIIATVALVLFGWWLRDMSIPQQQQPQPVVPAAAQTAAEPVVTMTPKDAAVMRSWDEWYEAVQKETSYVFDWSDMDPWDLFPGMLSPKNVCTYFGQFNRFVKSPVRECMYGKWTDQKLNVEPAGTEVIVEVVPLREFRTYKPFSEEENADVQLIGCQALTYSVGHYLHAAQFRLAIGNNVVTVTGPTAGIYTVANKQNRLPDRCLGETNRDTLPHASWDYPTLQQTGASGFPSGKPVEAKIVGDYEGDGALAVSYDARILIVRKSALSTGSETELGTVIVYVDRTGSRMCMVKGTLGMALIPQDGDKIEGDIVPLCGNGYLLDTETGWMVTTFINEVDAQGHSAMATSGHVSGYYYAEGTDVYLYARRRDRVADARVLTHYGALQAMGFGKADAGPVGRCNTLADKWYLLDGVTADDVESLCSMTLSLEQRYGVILSEHGIVSTGPYTLMVSMHPPEHPAEVLDLTPLTNPSVRIDTESDVCRAGEKTVVVSYIYAADLDGGILCVPEGAQVIIVPSAQDDPKTPYVDIIQFTEQ